MKPNKYVVKIDDHSFNVVNKIEGFNFIYYLLVSNPRNSLIVNSFWAQFLGKSRLEIQNQLVNEKLSPANVWIKIREVFQIFITDLHEDNIFYEYISKSKDSDFLKRQKIINLYEGLHNTIDYLYREEGVHIIEYYIEEKQLYEFLSNEDYSIARETAYVIPAYYLSKEFQNMADIIKNHYQVFLEESPSLTLTQNTDLISNETSSEVNLSDTNSYRNEIINTLIGKNEIFENYEKGLVDKGFLNHEKTDWLESTSSLIRFHNFCFKKNVLTRVFSYDDKRKEGFMKFRELYKHYDSESLNKLSKMEIAISSKENISEFAFLLSY